MSLPTYGPNDAFPLIAECRAISEAIDEIGATSIRTETATLTPTQHLFNRMLYNGKTTSFSIHLLNSWCMVLPALALLRVRAEQCIVASYLIHEDEDVGLMPFVQHVSVGRYLRAKDAVQDPRIRRNLDPKHVRAMPNMESEARDAHATMDATQSDSTTFRRQWTHLDLRSMARRRDVLVKKVQAKPTVDCDLEIAYLSVYRYASSIVHADCDSLSYTYLNVYASAIDSLPVLMANPSWVPIAASFCALFDIVQVSETLRWLGLDGAPECTSVYRRWQQMRNSWTDPHDDPQAEQESTDVTN